MSYALGDLERARARLTRALALAEGTADSVAQAELMLGHLEHAVGNEEAADEQFSRSVYGFQALGISWGIGNALSGRARVALATGHFDEAERLLDEATTVLRQNGPWFLLLTRYVRAVVAVRRGNADEAIALVGESLARIRELHERFGFVYALVPLASAAVLKGDDAWAARILGARDAVTERTGATVVDKSVRDLREQAESGVRARLGGNRWDRAYAAGRVTSIDSLLNDIHRVLRVRRAHP
jgi:ATP/maltotriose-dependent transcriptional regulator MalT